MRPGKKRSGNVIDKIIIHSAKRKLDHAKSTTYNSHMREKSSSRNFREKTKSDHVSLSNAKASMSQYNNTFDGQSRKNVHASNYDIRFSDSVVNELETSK